jgi:hypothetical protein
MTRALFLTVLAGSLTVPALFAVDARAGPVIFWHQIADQSAGHYLVNTMPSMNDGGVVAFCAVVPGSGQTIYTGSGGGWTQVAADQGMDAGSDYLSVDAFPTINNGGLVAFKATTRAGLPGLPDYTDGIFTGPDAVNHQIVIENASFSDFWNANPDLNDAGQVVFYARKPGVPASAGFYRASAAGGWTKIARGYEFSGGVWQLKSMNASGEVAFYGNLYGRTLLCTGNGTETQASDFTVIADVNGPFNYFGGTCTVRDSGGVGFRAQLDDGSYGVFIGDGSETILADYTCLADSAGAFSYFEDVYVDDSGNAFFEATRDDGRQGLYFGPDPNSHEFLEVGDALHVLGQASPGVVDRIEWWPQGANSQGEVAVKVRFSATGAYGIYRSATVTVPGLHKAGDVALDGGGNLLVGQAADAKYAIIGQVDDDAAGHACAIGAGAGISGECIVTEGGSLVAAAVRVAQDLAGNDAGVGRLTVRDGGSVVADEVHVGAGGVLDGDGGTVLADVFNHGTVAPGASPGEMTFEGDFTSDGCLAFQIADDEVCDVLTVTGDATLAGEVAVELLGGYVPAVGCAFTVLTAASITDASMTMDLPLLADGEMHCRISDTPSGQAMVLEVVPEPATLAMLAAGGIALLARRRRT